MGGKIKIADVLKFMIVYSLVANFAALTWGTPTALLYLNDFLMVMIAINCFQYMRKEISVAVPKPLVVVFALLVLVTVIGYIFNLYSPLYYAWGLRNNFRMFLYFFACCICLRRKDVYDICNLLYRLLPLNVVLCTIQYILAINSKDKEILQFIGDHVGGIFGSATGCNRMLNIYVIFIFSWAVAMFLKKKMPGKRLIPILISCVYISFLAELKVVLFEVALIVGVLIWLLQKRVNRFISLIFSATLCYALINIWGTFDPVVGSLLHSIEHFVNYASASTYGQDSLNRLTVIPYIQEKFFQTDVLKALFGMGLGNADTSGFDFLVSPFYRQYRHLKYNYFMSGMLYLETGIVGLITYCAFFVVNFFTCVKKIAQKHINDAIVYAGAAFNVIALLCIFYNTTLRSEVSSYMTFFFLAIPIIWNNTSQSSETATAEGESPSQ